MLRTTASMESSTSATQTAVEYDEVDGGGDQSIKKSSKNRQKLKSLKGLKNLQRPSVRRNIYQSTDPPSIKIRRTRTSLRALTVFRALFCRAQELSRYHVWSDYCQGKANRVADALSRSSSEESKLTLPHQVFICKMHVISSLNSGDVLRKKTS